MPGPGCCPACSDSSRCDPRAAETAQHRGEKGVSAALIWGGFNIFISNFAGSVLAPACSASARLVQSWIAS